MATLLPLGNAVADSPKPLFEFVGTLDRFPADARALLGEQLVPQPANATIFQQHYDGTLIAVPKARLLLQLFFLLNTEAAIAVRDLDDASFRILRTLRLPSELDRTTLNSGGDWSHAIDDTGTRLWLVSLNNNPQRVLEVNLRTWSVTSRPLPGQVTQTAFSIGGLTYDRYTDDLLVLFGGPTAFNAANSTTLLYRLDVSKPPPASFPPDELSRLYRLRSCSGPLMPSDAGTTYNWDMVTTEKYVYVPCHRAGYTVIVVRLTRPDSNDPGHQEDVAAGPVAGEGVFADQDSGRLFATTANREIWVFEAATMAFVGVVATGPAGTFNFTGFGLDPVTGRVFFQSSTFGLGVVEGRFFPIPQARTMPRQVSGLERIWSDDKGGHVFVLEGAENQKALAYRVYRTASAPRPPAPPDPDRNTTDIVGYRGPTEVRYNASGSGFGSRVLLANGYATAVPAPTFGQNAPTADLAKTLFDNPNAKLCGFTDRDLFAGRVVKAEYDTGSTAAKAVALAVDNTTEQDLNQRRCGGAGVPWDHKAAECASNEGNVPDKPARGEHATPPDFGPAVASCPVPGGRLTAEAETKATKVGVEVDRSWTKVTTERTDKGVTSTAESVAEGVSLAVPGLETLSVGVVRATAVSTSNGRPQRPAMSTHDVVLEHVRLGSTSLCEIECDPIKLERDLNLVAGGRAMFRTGSGEASGRDTALLEGSPRGAQTAVQKSTARQASDRALVGDFTVEVPALEMTVFNDNTKWGRARQIYQFAGVATSATYNIVVGPTVAESLFASSDPVAAAAVFNQAGTGFPTVAQARVGQEPVALELPATSSAHQRTPASSIAQVVRAVGRGLRLLTTSPRTALLLASAWVLLGSPALLARRRRLLAGTRSVSG